MLSWSAFFLVIAFAAVLLGCSSVAWAAVETAKLLFGVFLVLFPASLFAGLQIL